MRPQPETTVKEAAAETEAETDAARSAYSAWLSELTDLAKGSATDEVSSAVAGVTVVLPSAQGSANTTVLVPVTVGDLTGLNVTAYDFTVSFDPLILQPASPAFETAGTRTDAAGGYSVFVDPGQPSGKVRIGAFGTVPLSGSGTLIFLRLTVLAGAATSPLNFDNFTFGEGTPTDKTANGTFMRFGPTAAAVSLGGRVTTVGGRAVSKARVGLIGQNCEIRNAITNSFGFCRFDNVAAGETYVIGVQHKQYRFQSQVLSANENLSGINFIAEGNP